MIIRLRYILLYCAVFSIVKISAQQVKILEPAILQCEYNKRMVTDTLDRANDFKQETVLLRVGKTTSMYCSLREHQFDLLESERNLRHFEYSKATNGKSLSGIFRETVYKNYPTGKFTVYNHFDLMDWIYAEDTPTQQWEMLDSTKVILDYQCQLAQCEFRGRKWSAWFTQEIPISDGPWKLHGLPGLILEAYDTYKDYIYTATALTQTDIAPVGLYCTYGYDYAKTDRIKYLRRQYKAQHTDMGRQMAVAFGWKVPSAHKLAHRDYDLEETDYHE